MSSNQWYFTKEELTRGCTPEEIKAENQQRKTTCAYLQDCGMQLRLPQLTIATAVVFFHRFFVRHRLKDFDRHIIGATCLFLAGKVEETPKKLKDVIETTYQVRYKKEIKPDSPEFNELREQILTHELIVLQTIAFDLTVEHPYKYLLTYVKGIKGNRHLAQVAWNFVNDSLRTTLCLQFKPQLIASAAIYLASKFLKFQLPEAPNPWWEAFDAKREDLEEISNQILDLYESSPNMEAMKVSGASSMNGNGVGPDSDKHESSTPNSRNENTSTTTTVTTPTATTTTTTSPSSSGTTTTNTTSSNAPSSNPSDGPSRESPRRESRRSRSRSPRERSPYRHYSSRSPKKSPHRQTRSRSRSRSRSPHSRSPRAHSPRRRDDYNNRSHGQGRPYYPNYNRRGGYGGGGGAHRTNDDHRGRFHPYSSRDRHDTKDNKDRENKDSDSR